MCFYSRADRLSMATHLPLFSGLPSLSPSPLYLARLPFGNPSRRLLHFQKYISTNAYPSLELDPSVSPAVQTFWQWLNNEGIVSARTPVKPAAVPEGLGLVAKRDIAQGEVVLQVPKRLWINPEAVASSDIGSVCSGLKPWTSVALFLLRERSRDESSWRYYFDILPDSTDSTIYWSDKELSELEGTQLLSTTLSLKEYVKSEFLKLEQEIILRYRDLFPFQITLDDFLWAFAMLRSRAFSRLRGQNLVIVPFADLINHSSRVTSEDHAYEIKGAAGLFSWDLLFSLRSPLAVKAGEQIYIQYDLKKSNAELALDYGFIEPQQAERNSYTLTLGISESDPFFEDKLDIAETNGFQNTAYFDIFLDQPLPEAMLPYLRLVALGGTDAFLLESLFRNSIWDHLQLPVSRANEELICRVIRDACRSALSNYQTTIEEDEKLKKQQLESRLAVAVGVRHGEKKVLQHIDKIFEERELELDQLEYYQERRLNDLGLCGEQGQLL